MATTRLLELADVAELTELLRRNREFLRPWDPVRTDEFFTEPAQLGIARTLLDAHDAGTAVPLVILTREGGLAGRLNLNGVVRGVLQSAAMGYWVGEAFNGSGLATAAVAEAVELAAGGLGLHRLQAETLLHNSASQRVLAKNGFSRYGLAPKYLKIAGQWQDHLMFQRLLEP
ncbi:ribosomal-protein-alanine N-acetyltransferase [Arthrobacter stackebrandtii]|uniref:Ribosomal-protein-alanine N-acetyltransferase n=1 Tax=Arthrobacter stackebrandtii TaxID=272161 RepID=A0ABS4YWJ4_9MICC|nr:ribosomal-protein-alanine N-acetyltransferase [Arthrobacter stackebrandtii]PYH01244.1 alanine acetyltransferase [Arthrobacter stackebrandtii]